jgi:hypothetical protein
VASVVVAIGARLHQRGVARQPHQFGAELDELLHPGVGPLHQGCVLRLDQHRPLLHQFADMRQVRQHQGGVFFGLLAAPRHVDAAGIHHHGIDQPVDAFADDFALRSPIDHPDFVAVVAHGIDAEIPDRGGDDGKQADNEIKLRSYFPVVKHNAIPSLRRPAFWAAVMSLSHSRHRGDASVVGPLGLPAATASLSNQACETPIKPITDRRVDCRWEKTSGVARFGITSL